MWRKQDQPQAPSLPAQTKSTPITEVPQTSLLDQNPPAAASPLSSSTPGRLTRLLTVEGEITGQEDLFIDGEVHGKIRLHGGKLTIGPESRVTAEIEAREVVVRGEVKGNIKAHDRVRIGVTGRVTGAISTPLIGIEEGAEVHGLRVNLEKEERARPAGAIDSKSDKKVQVAVAEGISQVHA